MKFRSSVAIVVSVASLMMGCAAGKKASSAAGSGGGASTGQTGTGTPPPPCPRCDFSTFVECSGKMTDCSASGLACDAKLGCTSCPPGTNVCVGNEVHTCDASGQPGGVVQTCDVNAGDTCSNGACKNACAVAASDPSNEGCEFWAVQLDQQDAVSNPVIQPWGVALSNAGSAPANVTIEINEAPPGGTPQLATIKQLTVPMGTLSTVVLPVRTLDCSPTPNSYAAPGTCLSSNAFRITSSAPIVVYQFNALPNIASNDASLLLPTNALGLQYRIIGWQAGHPIPVAGIIDRAYITIVGTTADTTVTVKPAWRIKGNPPVAATAAGGTIQAKIGPFDVLNLETDDGTFSDNLQTVGDLSGSLVYSDKPVAVFSGTEESAVPNNVMIATPPNWTTSDTCCLDHLEDQMFPMESIGKNYVIPRSPIRSTTGFREPDVIRFVGAAEVAHVTTSLAAPFDSFTLQPGQVLTTSTEDNFVATGDKPFLVGQLLTSNQYADQGMGEGDPSLTTFTPVEQYRNDYIFLAPSGWDQSWVVISVEAGTTVTADGAAPNGCVVEPSGSVGATTYESQRCKLQPGAHRIEAGKPFGIVAYGYGPAGSYAVEGGAAVKHIYSPPPPM